MFARAVVGVAMLAGCNQVFGLNETLLIDAAPGTADALPTNCRVAPTFELTYDTYLLDDVPRGKESSTDPAITRDANLVDSMHPGLFRFGVGNFPDLGEHVAAAVVHVVGVASADECGSPCAPCATGATTYLAYWNRHGWSDADATSTIRNSTNLWDAPLATGPGDRSALVATHPLAATTDAIDLELRMTDVAAVDPAPWLNFSSSLGAYSLTIQILADAPIAFASDDRDASSCGDSVSPATLTLTLCK